MAVCSYTAPHPTLRPAPTLLMGGSSGNSAILRPSLVSMPSSSSAFRLYSCSSAVTCARVHARGLSAALAAWLPAGLRSTCTCGVGGVVQVRQPAQGHVYSHACAGMRTKGIPTPTPAPAAVGTWPHLQPIIIMTAVWCRNGKGLTSSRLPPAHN